MSETTTVFADKDVEIIETIDADSGLPQPMDVLLTPDERGYIVAHRYEGAGGETRIKLRPRQGQTPLYPSMGQIIGAVNDRGWVFVTT